VRLEPARIFRLDPVRFFRLFRLALALSLSVSALIFFLWSWRWPLVGDASLIHYIGFLIERGWAPYRDLVDMNMPGSYLIELAAMHLFGFGDLAWRLFDFTLLGIACAAFVTIVDLGKAGPGKAGRGSWLAAVFASCLFIVIHGRDGLAEGGQRDLTMAVLLIAATAFLFAAVRRSTVRITPTASWLAAAFGLLSGVAITIKPTVIPVAIAQILLAVFAIRGSDRDHPPSRIVLRFLLPAGLAWLVAPVIVLVFLLHERALAAFLADLHGLIPYYATLGHRPLGFILLHSLSPVLSLVLLWLAMLAVQGSLFRPALHWTEDWSRGWERAALLAGAGFTLLSCVVQARALPYYRYPLLAFLLPVMALDLTRALDVRGADGRAPARRPGAASVLRPNAARLLAMAALSVGGLFLAPQSAILIHRYRWREIDFIASLEQNLNALGGPRLSRHIQCIDTNSGCGTVLYRMSLEPASGVLSDFFLFGPSATEANEPPVIRQTRAQFTRDLLADPPQVLVVTSSLYLDDSEHFLKLDRWPAFKSYLAANYTLETEWSPTRTARWWSREETPASYRIYVLRSPPDGRAGPHP
jgi:hypothetical protein